MTSHDDHGTPTFEVEDTSSSIPVENPLARFETRLRALSTGKEDCPAAILEVVEQIHADLIVAVERAFEEGNEAAFDSLTTLQDVVDGLRGELYEAVAKLPAPGPSKNDAPNNSEASDKTPLTIRMAGRPYELGELKDLLTAHYVRFEEKSSDRRGAVMIIVYGPKDPVRITASHAGKGWAIQAYDLKKKLSEAGYAVERG